MWLAPAQEYLFRGIAKGEWQNLLDFLQAKKIRIDNIAEAKMGPGAGAGALDLGEDIDTGAPDPHAGTLTDTPGLGSDCKDLVRRMAWAPLDCAGPLGRTVPQVC